MLRKEVKVLRGCGYRKAGGLYLVGPTLSQVCDRLPFKIEVCPMCMNLHEFNRGITKTSACGIFHKEHVLISKCVCEPFCIVCFPSSDVAALMWVGKQFYTPESFREEAQRLGVSKRLPYIPKWLKLGRTWVFLAHPQAVEVNGADAEGKLFDRAPGVFAAFVPSRAEQIMTESEAAQLSQEYIDELDAQGIDIVTVPDGDPDHR